MGEEGAGRKPACSIAYKDQELDEFWKGTSYLHVVPVLSLPASFLRFLSRRSRRRGRRNEESEEGTGAGPAWGVAFKARELGIGAITSEYSGEYCNHDMRVGIEGREASMSTSVTKPVIITIGLPFAPVVITDMGWLYLE